MYATLLPNDARPALEFRKPPHCTTRARDTGFPCNILPFCTHVDGGFFYGINSECSPKDCITSKRIFPHLWRRRVSVRSMHVDRKPVSVASSITVPNDGCSTRSERNHRLFFILCFLWHSQSSALLACTSKENRNKKNRLQRFTGSQRIRVYNRRFEPSNEKCILNLKATINHYGRKTHDSERNSDRKHPTFNI